MLFSSWATLVLSAILTTFANVATANVEKTIFTAPVAVTIPNVRPSLQDLRLTSLTPAKHTLRANLPVKFPTAEHSRGEQSWFLLSGLEQGQRYEVRICWPATQPTEFWLDVYTITSVFDTPDLISALAEYSESLPESKAVVAEDAAAGDSDSGPASVLFLHIQAAADFFTLNKTLMNDPPDVKAEIILDPYILNIFPRSLIPTGIYIVASAVGSWFVASLIIRWITSIEPPTKPHKE
ncbi:uncharacterized protein J3D65DRAFT_551019 [Phyllosticta citribraziliensis]|uniref:Uncharacterized protein n=1 Tax=Phyllosticta citribraziliensis TaxID=989973 RepID=A0ABR1LXJ6_9PEZI